MLDLKFIRKNTDIVRQALENKKEKDGLNDILDLDRRRREKCAEVEQMKRMLNKASKEIAQINKEKQPLPMDKILENKALSQEIRRKDATLKTIEDTLQQLLLSVPNIPHESVPVGPDESFNQIVRTWGKEPEFDFKVQNHVELGQKLDILDFLRATKITGSGFSLYKGAGACLERALINFMLDFHKQKGRIEISSPILANEKTAEGTAHLPKFDQDMYKTREGFYLIPTAEMTLTNLHREETLKEEELPKKYCSYTPCFRTEAGRHGSETPGIFRVHQFDKVEMVTICKPKDNEKYLKEMLEDAEELLKKLKIPYRIIILCSGDNGFKEAITYDIETWSPALKKYMETSSVSSCTDFQARRMNTRYQNKEGLKLVYTLNGSGLALPRLLIAIIENNQTAKGSIKIPKVLHKYTGFKEIKQKVN